MKLEKAAVAFKALAHPHRLAIFLRLSGCCQKHGCSTEECSRLCVGELGEGLGIGQPTVSHHLKELAQAGLISTRKCVKAPNAGWRKRPLMNSLNFSSKPSNHNPPS